MKKFRVIDRFHVTERMQALMEAPPLAQGVWFVVEGEFLTQSELPVVGTAAIIEKPDGELIKTALNGRELRHRSAAFQFSGLELSKVPRLSVLSFDTEAKGPYEIEATTMTNDGLAER